MHGVCGKFSKFRSSLTGHRLVRLPERSLWKVWKKSLIELCSDFSICFIGFSMPSWCFDFCLMFSRWKWWRNMKKVFWMSYVHTRIVSRSYWSKVSEVRAVLEVVALGLVRTVEDLEGRFARRHETWHETWREIHRDSRCAKMFAYVCPQRDTMKFSLQLEKGVFCAFTRKSWMLSTFLHKPCTAVLFVVTGYMSSWLWLSGCVKAMWSPIAAVWYGRWTSVLADVDGRGVLEVKQSSSASFSFVQLPDFVLKEVPAPLLQDIREALSYLKAWRWNCTALAQQNAKHRQRSWWGPMKWTSWTQHRLPGPPKDPVTSHDLFTDVYSICVFFVEFSLCLNKFKYSFYMFLHVFTCFYMFLDSGSSTIF